MPTYTQTSKSEMPTVVDWDIVPEFKTQVSEYRSGKMVRNSIWPNPKYKFSIKYRTPMRKADIDAIKDFYIARKGRYEAFELYVEPLGTTHTVMFEIDSSSFNYFFNTLSNFGSVSFIEEVT